ncbi:MAG: hypothetical protein ACO2PN_16100 [Pyrobaculum sp.]|jgi:hypothetical protein
MEPWLVCRVILYAHRRRRALAAVRMWTALEPGTRAALLLRNGDGAVFQVGGLIRRSAAGEGHHRVEVQIPWDAALSLAAWAGKAVKEGDTAVLHGYVAQIKGVPPPPLKLVYDGYAVLRGSFIYKALDADAGRYFLELLLGGGSLLIPLKYYKYRRKNPSAGGDAGIFQLPLDAVRTLRSWGIYDPDADAVRLRMKVWAPAAWLIDR